MITPAVVIRPIGPPGPPITPGWNSGNHSAPSGPDVITPAATKLLGYGAVVIVYALKAPVVVTRPIMPMKETPPPALGLVFKICVNHSAPSDPVVMP